jgi:hypothetical protein
MSPSGRRAIFEVRDLPVIDTFQFANPVSVPATVSFKIEWEATGPPVQLGLGNTVPPTDPAAFLGMFAPARSTGKSRVSNSGSASHRNEVPALISAAMRRSEQSGTESSSHSAPEGARVKGHPVDA